MDWSWMSEDYVCFTETFDADAELSELCDDGESDAAGSSSSNGKDSDNEGHLLMILIILPTLLLVVIAWAILVMIKRRKLASICDRLRRPSAAAPPAHEPTPLSPSTLASIEASNLKMMGMMSEEPPQAAEPVAEPLPVKPGGAAVWGGSTVHYGGAHTNEARGSRISLAFAVSTPEMQDDEERVSAVHSWSRMDEDLSLIHI